MNTARSSPKAIAMIEGFEISDEVTYDRLYQAPTWPGGASGVTIGIGYDCGYQTRAEIQADWGPLVSPATLASLLDVAGLIAGKAHVACSQLGHIRISYADAKRVYEETDIPRTEAEVLATFPGSDALPGDSFGALTSLVFNRGTNCSNVPNRLEMYDILQAARMGQWHLVPGYIRAMKRLWVGLPNMRGLLARRDAEAALFEAGLSADRPHSTPAPPHSKPAPVSPPSDMADALDDQYNPGAA